MATYAIGDIHGCWHTLLALLDRIAFDPTQDRLWLSGDLVNRGPCSLEVLRWARDQGDAVLCVLGNHEIHLLGAALGAPGFRMRRAFVPLLDAPDADELLAWVASRPLMHRERDQVMVHAGLLPHWTLDHAYGLAARCEELLQGDGATGLLSASKSGQHLRWSAEDTELGQLANFLQVVTMLRLVDGEGQMVSAWVDDPQNRPLATFAWFDAPGRRNLEARIHFGHWAMLGLMRREDVVCLDSACVWGGKLSALRLEDLSVFQVDLRDEIPPRR